MHFTQQQKQGQSQKMPFRSPTGRRSKVQVSRDSTCNISISQKKASQLRSIWKESMASRKNQRKNILDAVLFSVNEPNSDHLSSSHCFHFLSSLFKNEIVSSWQEGRKEEFNMLSIIIMQLSENQLTLLRKGCNSEIFLWEEQDIKAVLKAVSTTFSKESKHLQNQWNILSNLSHDNIVDVYRMRKNVALPGKEGNYSLLAQEYADHGSLIEFMRKRSLSFAQRRLCCWEIAQGLHYLHGKSIVHRDIKLDNILIAEHQNGVTAKIADFGFATQLENPNQLVGSYKGTRRGYMAPQIHSARTDTALRYNPKAADIFAFGVVMFALFMGKLPFEFGNREDRLYNLLAEGKNEEFWSAHQVELVKMQLQEGTLTEQFKNIFTKLVSIDPQNRLSIEEVLSNPWMLAKKIRPSAYI